MRSKRDPTRQLPPYDGWVSLRPGETMSLAVDTQPNPSMQEQQNLIKHMRGAVLGHGFDIENTLIQVQLAATFGTLDSGIGGQVFQEAEEKLRRDPSLERKIDNAKPVIRSNIEAKEANKLIQDLAEYRRLRHLMAHRPCWLEGDWDPDAGNIAGFPKGRTTGFRLYIADESFVWLVDEAQAQEWGELLFRCMKGLEKVRDTVLPPAAAQPPT